jgi:hypothetical protein
MDRTRLFEEDYPGMLQDNKAQRNRYKVNKQFIRDNVLDCDRVIRMIAEQPDPEIRICYAEYYCAFYYRITSTEVTESTAMRLLSIARDKKYIAILLIIMCVTLRYRAGEFNWNNIYILFGEEYTWLFVGVKRYIEINAERIANTINLSCQRFGTNDRYKLNTRTRVAVLDIYDAENRRKLNPYAPIYVKDRDARMLEQSTIWVDENTGALLEEMPLSIRERIAKQILADERQLELANRACWDYRRVNNRSNDGADQSEDYRKPSILSLPNRVYPYACIVCVVAILSIVLFTKH